MKFVENLEIYSISSEGHGIGRHNNKVIFVPYAIPGDVVNVQIIKKKKKFMIGKILNVVNRSELYTKPVCSHFGECGGCKWLNLPYEEQLKFKQEKIYNAFVRIGKLEGVKIEHILPAPQQYKYRNKVEFSFNSSGNTLGFHRSGHWEEVVHINTCYLVPAVINDLRNDFYNFFRSKNVSFWDPVEHTGLLRQLIFRYSFRSNQVMVILITSDEDTKLLKDFTDYIAETHPSLHSLIWILSTRKNDSYQGLPYEVLYGYEYIEERLGDYVFEISPMSFFQTNTYGAEKLYNVVKSFLPAGTNTLLDLYCGTGSIALYLSDKVNNVVGIDIVEEAIKDARRNANRNNVRNADFIRQDLSRDTKRIINKYSPEVIVVDPPRAGLSKKLVRTLLEAPVEYIIYVSCNPATQARDLQKLNEIYNILKVQPVDMFPNTPHVENVVLLKKR